MADLVFRGPGEKAPRPEKLLTIDEVAAQLRCDYSTVKRHVSARRIQFARLGRAVRFRQVWVDEFLDRQFGGRGKTGGNDPSFS